MVPLIIVALLAAPEPAPAPAPAPAPEAAEQPPSAPESAPTDEADPPANAEADVVEPGRAPSTPEDAAVSTEAPALQGQPLPDAPPRVDPGTLDTHAWRGKGFFQIHVGAMVPLGGVRPGAGTVASAGGGLQIGWRVRPVFAIGAGLTTFLHDHDERPATDSAGETVTVRDFGRLTLFDPVFVRFYVPTRRKVEPRFDAGVLLGTYRPPFDAGPRLAAGARIGAGIDVWIGPAFSLDFGVDPRLIVVGGSAGVTLQAGMGATVHW